MSGLSSITPAGVQNVSSYPGMGMGGFGGFGGFAGGTGFGMDALLILLLMGGQNGMWGGNRGMGGPATAAIASDIVLQPAFQSLQNQITNLQQNISSDTVTGKISDLSAQLCASGRDLANANANNTREVAQLLGTIGTAQAAGNFTTLQSLNEAVRDFTAQNTQNLIQSINQAQNTNGLITNGFNQNYLSTLTGFNGMKDALCTISREMAECCCETKQAIERSICAGKDNTQAILNQMSHDKYAELLEKYNAVQAANSNLIQTNILKDNNAAQTATILQHLVPFFGANNNGNGNSRAA